MAANLPKLDDVSQLSPSITRILGGNPNKFTLQGTNTYLLGQGPRRILLDTAQGLEAWSSSLTRLIKEQNISVSRCLLTHWHHDHTLGVPDLLSLQPDAQVHKNQKNRLDPDGSLNDFPLQDIADGQRFDDGAGFEIEAVYCPGHTQDHMAFLITQSPQIDEIGGLFTGDNVLGHGTAVFENLGQYLDSLAVMRSKLGQAGDTKVKAYPAHGDVIVDAHAKIDEYLKHRKMREEEVLNVLRFGMTKPPPPGEGDDGMAGKEWRSMDIVRVVYADYPEHLYEPAEKGILMILEKLKGENKAVKTAEGLWRLGTKGML